MRASDAVERDETKHKTERTGKVSILHLITSSYAVQTMLGRSMHGKIMGRFEAPSEVCSKHDRNGF